MSSLPRYAVACAAVLAAFLSACASYHLGDSADLPFRTIHVAAPLNTSLAPQSAALLGAAVIQQLDRSGRVTIAPEDSADAILQITIETLDREVSAERANDTGLARKWMVTLSARCTLTDARSGKPFFENRAVSAFDEVYSDSGLVNAEYQNMPVLTRRLATEIGREVLSVW